MRQMHAGLLLGIVHDRRLMRKAQSQGRSVNRGFHHPGGNVVDAADVDPQRNGIGLRLGRFQQLAKGGVGRASHHRRDDAAVAGHGDRIEVPRPEVDVAKGLVGRQVDDGLNGNRPYASDH